MKKILFYLTSLCAAMALPSSVVFATDLGFELGADIQYFPNKAIATTQGDYSNDSNIYLRLEYDKSFYDGNIKLQVDTKAQYNQRDGHKSRGDFNELAISYFNGNMDITAGVMTEFWGVTESRHLVDIINQTNVAENIDEEVKLGQPMIKTQLHQDWGNIQFYWLPVFRDRLYPSDAVRLAPGDTIDYQHAVYESSDKKNHQDFALRYTHTIGSWDIGIAQFKGTSREPLLMLDTNALPSISFTPYYEQIEQSSIDLQTTRDSLLLKLEATSRTSDRKNTYYSAVTGFEYTQVGILTSAMDLGYIAEYLYDERDENASTPFADDLFVGLRLIKNDIAQTTYLLGSYIDLNSQSTAWRFEMDTRLQDGLTLSLEGQVFSNIAQTDLLYGFRNDDYLRIGMKWFF